ncbi:MAG: hypothetical protein Q8Q59_07715 [Luteolibacter sp.]|nr:hypothetical protein [Luteolibacter sp.]
MKSSDDFQSYEEGGGYVAHQYWQSLKSADFNDAVCRISAAAHWEIMLPAMGVAPADEARFFTAFDTPKAREARGKAVGGLLAVRNPREKLVLSTARNLAAAFEAGIVPKNTLDQGKGMLTGYLCECVEAGDWKSLDALSKLLKRGDTPEDARGGELSYEGQAWGAFCLLHLNHRNLPTKRVIREEMALKDHNRADFSKWLNALGLAGLPAE